MTNTEFLARLRVLANEPSAGFFQDADGHRGGDIGQNEIIAKCIQLERIRRLTDKWYDHPLLEPLQTSVTQNLVTGTQAYTFAEFSMTDFKESLQVQIKYSGVFIPATRVPFRELRRRELATYAQPGYTDPIYTMEGVQLTISPVPLSNVSGGLKLIYYKNPSEFNASNQFLLRSETHDHILNKGLAFILEKDGKTQEASYYQGLFDNYLNSL